MRTHSLRFLSIIVGTHSIRSLRQLVTLDPHSGSKDEHYCLLCFLLFIQPASPAHGMMLTTFEKYFTPPQLT